jgi:hypothetical protein
LGEAIDLKKCPLMIGLGKENNTPIRDSKSNQTSVELRGEGLK